MNWRSVFNAEQGLYKLYPTEQTPSAEEVVRDEVALALLNEMAASPVHFDHYRLSLPEDFGRLRVVFADVYNKAGDHRGTLGIRYVPTERLERQVTDARLFLADFNPDTFGSGLYMTRDAAGCFYDYCTRQETNNG